MSRPNTRTYHSQSRSGNLNPGFHAGLALLRIWMCFEVVLDHFYDFDAHAGTAYSKILTHYGMVAVCIFMLMAFTFTDMTRLSADNGRIARRAKRLLLPQVFWTLLYFAVYLGLDAWQHLDLIHSWSDLVWQLIFGHCYNQTAWYQFVLILLTLLFILIFRICSRRIAMGVTLALSAACLWIQYGGYTMQILSKIPGLTGEAYTYAVTPAGRVFEMLPYAALGIFACAGGWMEWFRSHRVMTVIGACFVIGMLFRFSVFTIPEGFGYAGFYAFFLASATLALFAAFPLYHLPDGVRSVLKSLSGYTMGIYFVHRMIGTLLYQTPIGSALPLHRGSLLDCALIFGLSLLVVWLLGRVPLRIVQESVGAE